LRVVTAPDPVVAPGWYPDPSGHPGQRYWDGQRWTDNWAPLAPDTKRATSWVGPVGMILAVVGVILSLQTVSVASGDGIVWMGVAAAVAGALLVMMIPGATR